MNELLLEFLDSILQERGKPAKMRARRIKNSSAAEQAKSLGLERKPGFGNYGPRNSKKVTHRSVGGKLVPIGETPPKKIGSMGKDPGAERTTQLKKDLEDPEKVARMQGVKSPDKTTVSIPDPDKSVRDMQLAGEAPEHRPNDVVEGIFDTATVIPLGPDNTPTAVRQIIDENGQVLDIKDPTQRRKAIEILNARIQKFHDDGTIRKICDVLAQKDLPRSVQTQLNKWLGNLGEVCGLRDMLEAGIESYMLQDSNAKNDIISVIDCGGTGGTANIQLVGISTKSSRGKKAGRIDANALSYISDTVAGKMVQLDYGRAGRSSKTFKAENVATGLFSMQKAMFRTLTRGTVEKAGAGKRKIVLPADDSGWDMTMFQQAVDKQKSGAGGQRVLLQARKITPKDIEDMFLTPGNPVGDKLLSDLTRIMDNNSAAAQALIQTLCYRLLGTMKKNKGTHFSLIDFNDWFTNEIVNIIDKPHQDTKQPSSLVFESDMMLASFDAEKGYVGMRLVTGESMTTAVERRYPEFSEMNTLDKLKQVLGWVVNPRGLVSSEGQGYVDAQQRAKPPVKLLKPADYKTIDKFVQEKCK